MKAVQLLVNNYLPEDLRNYTQTYDSKSINKILNAVAKKYPERFADISQKLGDIGRKASYTQGESITLADFEPVIDRKAIFARMDDEIKMLPKDKDFKQNRRDIYQKYNTLIESETSKAALASRNNIAMSVLSGARGKSPQLKAMISTPGTYSDYKGEPIDYFVRESFADGIRPAAFLASTYGSRASVSSTKCLDRKTLVRMGDLSVKRICDIQPGEYVLGADGQGKVLPVKVLDVFDQGMRDCYKYLFKFSSTTTGINDVEVCCTENHKFLMASANSRNLEVAAAGRMSRDTGASLYNPVYVQGAVDAPYGKFMYHSKELIGSVHCYDIEVDHPDHLFVLANGLITSNSATAKGGDWSKQLAATAADQVVRTHDCGSHNGIALDIDDNSLRGRVLARETGGIQAGTFITREIADKLRKDGVKHVLARSPLTCNTANGLCACCVGKFYNGGKLPKVGDSIGLLASSTLGEPVTTLALGAKHTAGMTKAKRDYAGLDYIQQFSQSPELFKDRAAVADTDGIVERVEEAPQGGKYITVSGSRHYVPAGHESVVTEGTKVEAGDQLSEGLVDPEDIVRLKGLGAGRLYYANRLNEMLGASGAGTDKRNTEVIARAALRHVRITDPEGLGNYLPDDMADYNAVQSSYKVPETARVLRSKDAIGKYLQQPIMHYSIGTRITPSMVKDLSDNDFNDVIADDTAPMFEPEMVRLRAASHTNPDWLASMGTSYLGKQLNEASTRGDDTNISENDDFRPRLAVGVGFGSKVRETGKF